MKRPEVFLKMKTEKENGTLTQLPHLHPSSKHEPDANCKQCEGTGWLIYPLGTFKELRTTFQYDGHDTTFCACTFFTDDVKELATSLIGKTVSKLRS
jgi:hypothetical protein